MPEQYRAGIACLGEQYDLVTHGKVTDELKRAYVERADELGIGDYVRSRFMFCGTPAEVESQIRAAMAAGARNFDGALDADLEERRHRIGDPGAPGRHLTAVAVRAWAAGARRRIVWRNRSGAGPRRPPPSVVCGGPGVGRPWPARGRRFPGCR